VKKFSAHLDIIGINPFVLLPDKILAFIFKQAGRDKGPIRVRGSVNGEPYRQTLVRHKGVWQPEYRPGNAPPDRERQICRAGLTNPLSFPRIESDEFADDNFSHRFLF
jgi:hypothetical protein